jgi:hypothetical protein
LSRGSGIASTVITITAIGNTSDSEQFPALGKAAARAAFPLDAHVANYSWKERTYMKSAHQLLFAVLIILMVGAAASHADAQTATGRALFAYPMKGQTPDQENADRAACHNWAVTQTGFDPTLVYAAQQAGVPTRTISDVTRKMVTPGGIGGARGNAEVRRINDLYDAYLRAGQTCLEARGYQVSR